MDLVDYVAVYNNVLEFGMGVSTIETIRALKACPDHWLWVQFLYEILLFFNVFNCILMNARLGNRIRA